MKNGLKELLKQMGETISEMVDFVYQGLMENDAHYLNRALNKEIVLDNLEKKVTEKIIELGKAAGKENKKEFIILGQIAQNLERMGDELRSLIERIEIKIAEKLLFSDVGIKQYEDVFSKMAESVNLIIKFLNEYDTQLLNLILENGNQIKTLIEKYRAEHVERLAKGICEPRAANMYFDMLDFTGNIARHCTNIARVYKET